MGAYTATVTDAGRVVRAMVSYDDAVGMGREAASVVTAAVDQKGAVTLSPQQPVVGEAVTGTLTDADGDITSQAWQWRVRHLVVSGQFIKSQDGPV